MRKQLFYALIITFSVFALNLEAATIRGMLIDGSSSEALIEGNIYLEGTNYGTASNDDGFFIISSLPKGKYTLIANYVGYKPFKKVIIIRTDVQKIDEQIKLQPDALQLEAVVVEIEGDQEESREEAIRNIKIGELKISPRKMATSPTFVMPDLFRTIKTGAGVVSTSDYSTGLFIRGSDQDQNLVLYDDMAIYNASHLFGMFSAFITDAVRDVKVIKSAYGAEYDGKLGAVVDVKSRDGNKEHFEGTFSQSLVSSEGFLTGPFLGDGGFLAAVRRTYFDFVVKDLNYHFLDGQFQVYQDFGLFDRIIVSAYFNEDNLDLSDDDDKEDNKIIWGNKAYSMRWRHIFGSKLFSKFSIIYSNPYMKFVNGFDNDVADEEDNAMKNYKSDFYELTFRSKFEYFATNDLNYRLGAEVKKLKWNLDFDFFDVNDKQKYEEYLPSVFLDVKKTWLNVFTINPGIRMEYINFDKEQYLISPRLSMKYMLSDKSSISTGMGRYFQYMYSAKQEFSPMQMINMWMIDGKDPSVSDNISFSYDYSAKLWSDTYKFTGETYYKDMDKLKALRSKTDEESADGKLKTVNSSAYSYGAEFTLAKNSGRIAGNVSYAYSKVRKKYDTDKKSFSPCWDTPHSFKMNLQYNITKKFNLGTALNYSSGKPYIEDMFGDYTDDVEIKRTPAYFRWDISSNYTWFYQNGRSLLLNISVLNLTNRKNVMGYDGDGDAIKMFPLLPTFRLSYSF